MSNSDQFDKVVLPPKDNYVNPVGVKYSIDTITLTQGVANIVLTHSMLHEISEIRSIKVCDV